MIAFTIVGVPAPQGSKTAVMTGGRVRLIEGGSQTGRDKHRAWRQTVAVETMNTVTRHGPIDDNVPVRIRLQFSMPKPKSRPNYALWADRKPDLDKLIRSTLDGLADGGLLRHDSRVVDIHSTKTYAAPGQPTGCLVVIDMLTHQETANA